MQSRRRRVVSWLGILLCAAAIGVQFVRPHLTNPSASAEIQAPLAVRQILRTSCYNCHSNETKLSLLDRVVPAYWLVASDVQTARHHLNFSEIGKLPVDEQKSILFEAVNKIQLGAMPLPSYLAVHPHAAVTDEELAILRAYLGSPTPEVTSVSNLDVATAKEEVGVRPGQTRAIVRPAPNGIEFISDYKNWKAISSTDRFDNNTVRVVLGNDLAVKAIAADHINPGRTARYWRRWCGPSN